MGGEDSGTHLRRAHAVVVDQGVHLAAVVGRIGQVAGCRTTWISVEQRVVGKDVPADAADPCATQLLCELQRVGTVTVLVELVPVAVAKCRIAAAVQVEVSVPDAALPEPAGAEHRRLQVRLRSEQVQARNRCVQLLHRRGRPRDRGGTGVEYLPVREILDEQSNLSAGVSQRMLDLVLQQGVCRADRQRCAPGRGRLAVGCAARRKPRRRRARQVGERAGGPLGMPLSAGADHRRRQAGGG